MLKILFISTCSPADRWLIKEIIKTERNSKVLKISWSNSLSGSRAKKNLFRYLKRITTKINELYRDYIYNKLDSYAQKKLGRACILENNLILDTANSSDLHSPDNLMMIADFKPDLIITSGAPLLKASIYELPRLGCINIHYGIAPDYRGEWTLFWPYIRQDFKRIGVTIHQIDSGIDTGKILLQDFINPKMISSEADLWLKAHQLAKEMLIILIKSLSDNPDQIISSACKNTLGTKSLLIKADARCIWHETLWHLARWKISMRSFLSL